MSYLIFPCPPPILHNPNDWKSQCQKESISIHLIVEKQQAFPQLANSYTQKYLRKGMDWHYFTGKKKLDLRTLLFHLSHYLGEIKIKSE